LASDGFKNRRKKYNAVGGETMFGSRGGTKKTRPKIDWVLGQVVRAGLKGGAMWSFW